jgi:hypothetical protein
VWHSFFQPARIETQIIPERIKGVRHGAKEIEKIYWITELATKKENY